MEDYFLARPASYRFSSFTLPLLGSMMKFIDIALQTSANLLPSFLDFCSSKDQTSYDRSGAKVIHQARVTSLDGLRGVAALSVATHHIVYAHSNAIWFGNGVPYRQARYCGNMDVEALHDIKEEQYNQRSRLLQLPFVRILAMSSAAVAIFFIISGYVLTKRPLRLARDQRWDSVLAALSSATFRRPLRLFPPLLVATFLNMLLTYMGLMDKGLGSEDLWTAYEPATPVASNLPTQFVHWLHVVWRSLNVWDWSSYYPPYDPHLWTISAEFRASMVLFLVTVMLCRLKSRVRLALVCLSIVYSVFWFRWDMALFLSGMLFAETSQIQSSMAPMPTSQNFRMSPLHLKWWPSSLKTYQVSRLLLYLFFLSSLYLLSTPGACTAFTPGYSFLAYISPKSLSPTFSTSNNLQFHQCIGAVLLVGLLIHWTSLNPLPPIFDTKIAQYLGRISYGLYIVHGPSLHLFGYRLFPVMWRLTGRDTMIKNVSGWFMSYTITMMAIIWLADLFHRGVDEPFVRLARTLEKRVLSREGGTIRLG